ncbi:hypothetical protein ACH5RR_000956 [Cinchona calisaya]|uniref:DUF4005 domain-containing protein n=1 Tax=Cinchona calisaya TaxID=153742 RepID=A0ABD3B2K7_9GENT
MAKKKKNSWFNLLKRLFFTDTNSRSEKKDKRKRLAFGRFKSKRLACLSAPSPPKKRILDAAEDEKQKCDENVAITTAAAEAPETNNQDFWLGGNHQTSIQYNKEPQEFTGINVLRPVPQSHQCELEIDHLAAIKIQSAFRGYLARKALRALKGLVRLQAIIRGWAVRRQAINTLKCLQTVVNIQSEFCAKRCDMVKTVTLPKEENKLLDLTEKDIKIDSNSQKRWDDSILSKEEANALSMNKRVASIRRERIKEYWLNHRRSTESEQSKLNVKQRYWLEQWVDSRLAKREDLHNLGTVFSANAKNKEELTGRRLRLRNLQKQYQIEGLDSPINIPRRSFHHRRQHSIEEDGYFEGSPAVPTYMAATESAKAKVRSMSSPRLRPINFDAYSEINSPYKHKLSPISSINSDMTSCSQISKSIGFSQRSPCLKGVPGPVKSYISIKDLNFIAESNNDQLNAYE